MFLTRNPIARTAGAALLGVLLTALPAFAARPGWSGGGYRGGWGGYNGGWGGYNGGWGGYYGRGFGIGIGTAPYYDNGYYGPNYVVTPSPTVVVTPDVNTTQSSYFAPAAPDDRAHIDVRVPPDAQVFFDGSPTRQTGEERMFVSPPLDPGRTYNYNIEARWMDNGKMVDQTKTVTVGPGASPVVDFTR